MPFGELSYKTREDGWEMVHDQRLIEILKKTEKTPWETSAFTQLPIVPAWVLEAIQKYDDAGGYAGMSPSEFLDKVADEQPQDQPKHTF